MFTKVKKLSSEYPAAFKVLVFSTFIDRLGGFLLNTFFALYVTKKFGIGMTQVGFMFMLTTLGGILGNILGGALTDKVGRRFVALFGLVVSGLGSLLMGVVNQLEVFYVVSIVLGALGWVGGPARSAMVADILPEEKRSDGFGIMRVAVNIAATVGPILGGIIASKSYISLFIADAVSSLITALLVLKFIPETKPEAKPGTKPESVLQTMKGYGQVLKDTVFLVYIGVMAIMTLVYLQLYSTLSVYLRDFHGYTEGEFGYLFSLNALMVVLLQFAVTRIVSKRPPMYMMALGALCYGIGFGMFGFVSSKSMVYLAIAILTVGEMINMPVGQALGARFSPPDKRGRYMAVYAFAWTIPNLFGVMLAGAIMDNYIAEWVWYGSIGLSAIAIIGFLLLHRVSKHRFAQKSPTPEVTHELDAIHELEPASLITPPVME